MSKIVVENPVVEIYGDEMTRIIWDNIKAKVSFLVFKSNTFNFVEIFDSKLALPTSNNMYVDHKK